MQHWWLQELLELYDAQSKKIGPLCCTRTVKTQIIICTCVVWSWHSLLIDKFYNIQWFCKWEMKALIRMTNSNTGFSKYGIWLLIRNLGITWLWLDSWNPDSGDNSEGNWPGLWKFWNLNRSSRWRWRHQWAHFPKKKMCISPVTKTNDNWQSYNSF